MSVPKSDRAEKILRAPLFSVVVSVGPGDSELARLNDLVMGLGTFEREHLQELVIVDDSCGKHVYVDLVNIYDIRVRIVKSPRAGGGDSWRGGLTTNVLFGLKAAFAASEVDFVLKVDTDTLVIGPIAKRIKDRFNLDEAVGILGSQFSRTLHGKDVEPSSWRVNLQKWTRLVRLRRNPTPRIETALFGRNRLIRLLIRNALANRWPLGACAQGGGYAVGRKLFTRVHAAKHLHDDFLWMHTDLGEDVVLALLCYAVAMRVADDNEKGGVFGVQYVGLGFGVEELYDRGYGVVHSVKMQDWVNECEIRRRFAEKMRSS